MHLTGGKWDTDLKFYLKELRHDIKELRQKLTKNKKAGAETSRPINS